MGKRAKKNKSNSVKRNEILTQLDGQVPDVLLPRDEWLDVTISKDFFWIDIRKRDLFPRQPAYGELRFMGQEPRVGDRALIDSSSILRFRNERKELPLSESQFPSPKLFMQLWGPWVEYIVKKYGSILQQAGVYDSIWITSKLSFIRAAEIEIWRAIICRWSTQTHSFITSWGEVTPTLEDVCMLLGMHDVGLTDIASAETSEEDEGLIALLESHMEAAVDSRRQLTFASWLKYFFKQEKSGELINGPGYDSKEELMAFLSLWLSLFIFPGGPENSISPRFFHLAIRISRGERFALSLFYLGSLYRRLDLYHKASVRSKGRYVVMCYADMTFLQLFFAEHYKKYFDPPLEKPDVVEPRA